MRPRIIKTLVFILVIAFYGSLLTYKIKLPVADDMARHIKNGELILSGHFDVLYSNVYSYTEPGHPFINHHWLSGVIFYLLHQAVGWSGLVIFKVIVLLSAFTLFFLAALKKAVFWLVAFFSLPAILILIERSSLRPEIFSYLFIGVFLYLLMDLEEHPERKRIFWLIPLGLLWVNMHVFWSIGVMMVAGFLLEKIILNLPAGLAGYKNLYGNPLIKKLTFLLAALVLVAFINPNGARGVFYSYPRDFPILIGENQSLSQFQRIAAPWADVSVAIFKPALFLLAISFFFGFRRKQKPWFLFFAGTATAALSFYMLRGIPLFGLIFLPAVSANFNEVFTEARDFLAAKAPKIRDIAGKILIIGLIAAFLYFIFFVGQQKLSIYTEPGIGLAFRSDDAALFFKEQNLKGPIFNDTDIGSYLIYHLFPQEKVFADNLFGDAYSASFFSDTYLPMLANEDVWQTMLQNYQFNVIFFYQYDFGTNVGNFLRRRVLDPSWSLVYADTYNLIFLRNIPENQNVIKKFQITRENAGQKLEYMAKSPNFEDQVAAADIFNLIGREDLGADMFLKVVAKWPERGKIWMIMGEWELNRNGPESVPLAMMYLERAVAEGWKTAEANSFLGAAYIKMGQFEKAKETLQIALKINPERQDAKELLKTALHYIIQSNENGL